MEEPRESGPSPMDLDLVGTRHPVAPYWLEEIALLLRRGATDSEILAGLRAPDSDDADSSAGTFPLDDEHANTVIAELRSVIYP
jgi:hypothetical protein